MFSHNVDEGCARRQVVVASKFDNRLKEFAERWEVDRYLSAAGYLSANVKPFFIALPKVLALAPRGKQWGLGSFWQKISPACKQAPRIRTMSCETEAYPAKSICTMHRQSNSLKASMW